MQTLEVKGLRNEKLVAAVAKENMELKSLLEYQQRRIEALEKRSEADHEEESAVTNGVSRGVLPKQNV
eukprot:802134-Karenia_brevis.AAC.1